MLKELCATLLILCNPILSGFDFDYAKDDRDQFVQAITECTIKYNTAITPFARAIVVISVAQAIIESNWGESRFAREANNFYGVIQTAKTEPHIKSLRGKALLKINNIPAIIYIYKRVLASKSIDDVVDKLVIRVV